MLALSVALWFYLVEYWIEIGGHSILGAAIGLLFFLDLLYRLTVVHEKLLVLRENEKKLSIFKKDYAITFPQPISILISDLGGMLYFIPCWLAAVITILVMQYIVLSN